MRFSSRNKRDISQYERDRRDLSQLIKEEHRRHPSYGYHALAKIIRDKTGWIFSDNLCHKVCKQEGVRSKCRHYRYRKTGEEHTIYPNIIRNNRSTERPLQKIVSDMTVINHRGKLYERTFFLDTYNNAIIASDISSHWGDPKPYFTCRDESLRILKEEGITEPVYFRTDQGAVYSSASFNQALLKIIPSFAPCLDPEHQRIIRSLKL